jgi:radical SAM protein with 4Fe4S-binding SPASM domain
MQHNFNELPELLKLVEKMGIKQFVSGALVASGRASASSRLALPSAAQYRSLLIRFQNDKDFRDRYHRIGNIAALEWSMASGSDSAAESCCSFIETPYVTANGNLYPCVMFHHEDYAAKRVYERPLAESITEMIDSWSRIQEIKKLRLAQIADCKPCSHYSVCGGGCLGRAYSVYGDFFAKEDRCRHRQAIYEWFSE